GIGDGGRRCAGSNQQEPVDWLIRHKVSERGRRSKSVGIQTQQLAMIANKCVDYPSCGSCRRKPATSGRDRLLVRAYHQRQLPVGATEQFIWSREGQVRA